MKTFDAISDKSRDVLSNSLKWGAHFLRGSFEGTGKLVENLFVQPNILTPTGVPLPNADFLKLMKNAFWNIENGKLFQVPATPLHWGSSEVKTADLYPAEMRGTIKKHEDGIAGAATAAFLVPLAASAAMPFIMGAIGATPLVGALVPWFLKSRLAWAAMSTLAGQAYLHHSKQKLVDFQKNILNTINNEISQNDIGVNTIKEICFNDVGGTKSLLDLNLSNMLTAIDQIKTRDSDPLLTPLLSYIPTSVSIKNENGIDVKVPSKLIHRPKDDRTRQNSVNRQHYGSSQDEIDRYQQDLIKLAKKSALKPLVESTEKAVQNGIAEVVATLERASAGAGIYGGYLTTKLNILKGDLIAKVQPYFRNCPEMMDVTKALLDQHVNEKLKPYAITGEKITA